MCACFVRVGCVCVCVSVALLVAVILGTSSHKVVMPAQCCVRQVVAMGGGDHDILCYEMTTLSMYFVIILI